MNYTHHYLSPLGGITIASDGSALTGLWFDGQKYFGAGLEKTPEEKSLPIFDQADRWLDLYFSGRAPDFTPELVLTTTEFRKNVWGILMAIPFGRTRTYGEIANQLAAQKGLPSMSAQAVGNAVGRNPISLIIPCHRVVGANGSLVGFAGGVDRKAKLLALESADMRKFFIPKSRLRD